GTGNEQNVEGNAGLSFEMPELGGVEDEPVNVAAEENAEGASPFNETVMMELPAEQEAKPEAGSFDLPDLGAPTISDFEQKPDASSDAGNDLNFDFDTSLETAEPVAESSPEEEVANPPEIDLSGISLDFGPTIDNPEAGNEGLSEASLPQGESSHVETKLD